MFLSGALNCGWKNAPSHPGEKGKRLCGVLCRLDSSNAAATHKRMVQNVPLLKMKIINKMIVMMTVREGKSLGFLTNYEAEAKPCYRGQLCLKQKPCGMPPLLVNINITFTATFRLSFETFENGMCPLEPTNGTVLTTEALRN